jgi:prokaryotic ubiquitin-like protein Pup
MHMTTNPLRTRRDASRAGAEWLPIYAAAEGGQKQVPKKGGDDAGNEKGAGPQKLAKKGEKLKDEMDALVDEIDEVLEENAEEFVKNYVQRGGE